LATESSPQDLCKSQSCHSSGVIEWPIERRWWTAGAIDVDGGAQT
jgi:hypothetical protein